MQYFWFLNSIISQKMKLRGQTPTFSFQQCFGLAMLYFQASHRVAHRLESPVASLLGRVGLEPCDVPTQGTACGPCPTLPSANAAIVIAGFFPSIQRLQPLLPGFFSQLRSHHLRRDRARPVQPFGVSQRQPGRKVRGCAPKSRA